jgi:hypothetical protein
MSAMQRKAGTSGTSPVTQCPLSAKGDVASVAGGMNRMSLIRSDRQSIFVVVDGRPGN